MKLFGQDEQYLMETSEMNSLFGEFVLIKFVLIIIEHLVDKPNGHWNEKWCWRVFQVVGPELKLRNYSERKLFWTWSAK